MIRAALFSLSLLSGLGLAVCASADETAPIPEIYDVLQARSESGLATLPAYVPYRHTVEVTVSGSKGEEIHEPLTATLRIDPSRPGGERVTILARSGEARGEMEKALREMIEEIEDPDRTAAIQAQSFWCQTGPEPITPETYSLIELSPEQATLKPSAEAMVSLFMQTGDRELDRKERSMARKLSDRLDGHVVLDARTGQMESARFHITRPMTVLMIAKIREMVMEQGCSLAPNGHPYVSDFSMDVEVTALGSRITNVMELTVSDLELIEGMPEG